MNSPLSASKGSQNTTVMDAAVQIDHLIYRTPNRQFELVIDEFELSDGSSLAITGRSGTGKSTLLNLIAGRLTPIQGQILVLGQNLLSLNDQERRAFRHQKIGFVFQDFRLIPYLNIRDNIQINRFLMHRPERQPPEAGLSEPIEELAEKFGIQGLLKRHPDQLSQGEQQRVAIARAISMRPGLLLADEPTGNLDPDNAHHALELMQAAARELKASLIVVTHDHTILDQFDRRLDMTEFCK